MSWRLRLSVETILRLTPAVLGSIVFSIAGLCAAHACLDDQAQGLESSRSGINSEVHWSKQHLPYAIDRFDAMTVPPTQSGEDTRIVL